MAEPNKQKVEEVKVTASEAEKANAQRTSRMQAEEDKARAAAEDEKSDDEKRAEEEQRQREEEEAKAAQERDDRRKSLVEEIAGSDEGFVTRSESNGQAIDEAFADGYLYNSNTQKGIEVEERYYLTQKGFDTRQS